MPVRTPIRAIALDLDDTLWPMRPALLGAERALTDWLARHAPRTAAHLTPQARGEIRARLLAEHPQRAHDVSFLRRESLRVALDASGEDAGLADEAFEVFLAARQRVALYDDVVPVLARWALRYRLVAISNGNADLARVGLGAYFVAHVAAHEIGFGKPDARIFLEACRRVAAQPAAVLHLGDDPELDVRAARSAGLQAAWIRRPDLAPAGQAEPVGEPVFDSLLAVDAALHPRASDRSPPVPDGSE